MERTFTLTKEQDDKFKKWKKSLPVLDCGTIGGGYQFIFIPTGLGNIVKVKRDDGFEIDLSDVGNW